MKMIKRDKFAVKMVCPLPSSSFLIHAYDHKIHAQKSSLFDLGKGQMSNMNKIEGNFTQIRLMNNMI